MKRYQTQIGSTKSVVIIALIIALAATLGIIAWQRIGADEGEATFSTKPKITKNTNDEVIPDEDEMEDSSNSIVLEDWGIKFDISEYDLPTGGITYRKSINNHEAYEFSTARVEALGQRCSTPDGRKLATISRVHTAAGEQPLELQGTPINESNPIDGYTYYTNSAQATCSDEGMSVQIDDMQLLLRIISNPEPIS